MRILGFSKKWSKLDQDEFTTFRFTRKDKDWEVGEQVKVVYKPRRKGGGDFLGVAEIKSKEPRSPVKLAPLEGIPVISDAEAQADGFEGKTNRYGLWISPYFVMWEWLWDIYGVSRLASEPIRKLTLKWIQKGA